MERICSAMSCDAEEYAQEKLRPFRLWIERWSIFQAVLDNNTQLVGKRVGDFGSGTGYYSRMLIDLGAASILAIDSEPGMIQKAKEDSASYNPLITYDNACLQDTKGEGECSLVLGSYIMNFPKTPEETLLYCQSLVSHLETGGVFIGFLNNPYERSGGEQYKPYGFWKEYTADRDGDYDGCPVDVHIDGLSNPIRNYNILPETYEWAFREAGMDMEWREVEVHPSQKKSPYWNLLFDGIAPVNMVSATRI